MGNIYLYRYLISAHEVNGICGICIAFEGHICCSDICGHSMVNKVFCFVLTCMCSTGGLHVDYIISTVRHTHMMWQAYLIRAYTNNVKLCISVLVVTLLIILSLYEV